MPKSSPLACPQKRQHLVRFALRFTQGTALEPQAAERALLDQFVRGELTIDQVAAQLVQ